MQDINSSFSIGEFLSLSLEDFLGRLTKKHLGHHSNLVSNQKVAWEKEYDDLQSILKDIDGKRGRIIFEYSIPSLPKTIDVVLLLGGIIFVIEYKANSTGENDLAKRQTKGYALRLKFFHSRSNDKWIVPILVSTDAPGKQFELKRSDADMVYEIITCNSANLKTVLDTVLTETEFDGDSTWEDKWETGIFKASPTIIDAARNVWRSNNVVGFTKGEAEKETRLLAED